MRSVRALTISCGSVALFNGRMIAVESVMVVNFHVALTYRAEPHAPAQVAILCNERRSIPSVQVLHYRWSHIRQSEPCPVRPTERRPTAAATRIFKPDAANLHPTLLSAPIEGGGPKSEAPSECFRQSTIASRRSPLDNAPSSIFIISDNQTGNKNPCLSETVDVTGIIWAVLQIGASGTDRRN
jgi:hypothetical protein